MAAKYKDVYFTLNTVFTVLALLSVFSFAELPLLHELHHHEQTELSSSKELPQTYKSHSKNNLETVSAKYSCPLCSIGGSANQLAVDNVKTYYLNRSSIVFNVEPMIPNGINFLYTQPRAPPAV